MNFSKEKPPIFDRLHEKFGVEWGGSLCIAYGDTLHYSQSLHPSVIVHEQVHMDRQKDPVQWWESYIRDPKFRFVEELLAYRAQYQYLKDTTKDRNELARHWFRLAGGLSGKMYGGIVTHQNALKLLKAE